MWKISALWLLVIAIVAAPAALAQEAKPTQEQDKAGLESTRENIVRQIDLAQQRTWSLERLVLDLENELAAKRRDVEALEEVVMEGLSDF